MHDLGISRIICYCFDPFLYILSKKKTFLTLFSNSIIALVRKESILTSRRWCFNVKLRSLHCKYQGNKTVKYFARTYRFNKNFQVIFVTGS